MTIRSDRPRLWLTPATLATLKARAAVPTSRWQTLKQWADKAADWNIGIVNYCLAYQVTGDAGYVAKAWSLMQQSMAAGLGQVTGDSGYQCRNYFVAASILLDWGYSALTPAQRTQLATDIAACADWVWPETNPSRKGAWAIDAPGNNYYHGFMLTWLAGLALFGDSPKAQGYIDNALAKWNTVVLPYLTGTAVGGCFLEGSNYGIGSLRSLLYYLLAHSTATDQNLMSGTPWTMDAIGQLISQTTPTLDQVYPSGDQALNSGRQVTDYDRTCALIESLVGTTGRIRGWLDSLNPNVCQQPLNAFAEFLWYPEETPASPLASRLTASYAPGAGIATSRRDWKPDSPYFTFQAGPTLEDHQDRAQGEFLFFQGSWLAAQAKLFTQSGICQDTQDHNCLTVDSRNQVFGQTGCRVTVQEDTAVYGYYQADLAAAYIGQLNQYQRECLFLKSGFLLIRDTYQPVSATSQVVWHLQTLTAPTPLPGGFQDGKLFGIQGVGVGGGPFTFTKVLKSAGQATPTYRVDWPGDTSHQFLAALAARADGNSPLGKAINGGGVQGIQCGGDFVAWLTGPGPWTYPSPAPGNHYLIGLKPNTAYQIAETGQPVMSRTTSAAGILAYSGAPVGAGITVAEGASPPPPPPPAGRTFTLFVPAGGAPVISEVPSSQLLTPEGASLRPGEDMTLVVPRGPTPDALP